MRRVRYEATGLEGTDFTVDIGATLPADDYDVFAASCGVALPVLDVSGPGVVPVMDLPAGPGDRTTTTFRVVTADVLSAGDKLAFLVVR